MNQRTSVNAWSWPSLTQTPMNLPPPHSIIRVHCYVLRISSVQPA